MNVTELSDKLIVYAHEGLAELDVYIGDKKIKDVMVTKEEKPKIMIILCEEKK